MSAAPFVAAIRPQPVSALGPLCEAGRFARCAHPSCELIVRDWCSAIISRLGDIVSGTKPTGETCGHEFELSGVGYQCQRAPHSVDDGTNIPKAPYRHAAAIDAELAEGTDEDDGYGEADLITWGEDETGEGQDWDLAWGDVGNFVTQSHGAYRPARPGTVTPT